MLWTGLALSRNDYQLNLDSSLHSLGATRFAMSLPLHFQFEKLQLQGAIQQASDLNELKEVAGQLLDLYFMQKAATARVISEK